MIKSSPPKKNSYGPTLPFQFLKNKTADSDTDVQ